MPDLVRHPRRGIIERLWFAARWTPDQVRGDGLSGVGAVASGSVADERAAGLQPLVQRVGGEFEAVGPGERATFDEGATKIGWVGERPRHHGVARDQRGGIMGFAVWPAIANIFNRFLAWQLTTARVRRTARTFFAGSY